MPAWLPLALVVPLLMLSVYLQYTHTLREVDGALHVGQTTYGDLCLHLGIATGLQGSAYPPDYTLIPDVLLGYPFLMDALSASMISLRTGLAASFVIPGSLMMGLVFLGFVILAWELTHSRAAVVVSYLLMFLNGGLGFFYVLDGVWQDPTLFQNVFTGYYAAPANMVENNIRWVNVICDMMIPQRTLLAGWTMVVPALYLLSLALREGNRRLYICLLYTSFNQVLRAAHRLQLTPAGKIGIQRHQVDGAAGFRQRAHGGKDLAVGGVVKIVVCQRFHGQQRRFIRAQHRPQHRPFGFGMVGRGARLMGKLLHATYSRPSH